MPERDDRDSGRNDSHSSTSTSGSAKSVKKQSGMQSTGGRENPPRGSDDMEEVSQQGEPKPDHTRHGRSRMSGSRKPKHGDS